MNKITVKHYLNTNLKPYIIDNEKYYKVYFLLRYQNKNTKIKSLTNSELTENQYTDIINDATDILNKRFKNECNFVESIIQKIEKSKIAFDINVFNDFWNLGTYPIIENFQNYIKWIIERDYFIRDNDFYRKLNYETFDEILQLLKKFVSNNEICITDEIFYNQLNDKNFVVSLNNHLKTKKKFKIWIIKSQIVYNTINFLIENLILNGGFNMSYKDYTKGSSGDSIKYFKNIIDSFTEK